MLRKQMTTALVAMTLSASMLATGCGSFDTLLGLLGPSTTSVRFVNNSDFAVEGRIIIGDQQLTTEELLEQFGTEISFSVAAVETTTISRDCDDLQALLLDDANLQVIGDIGPDARSGVLRDGDDFNCGDRITFTFDHSAQITDFDVTTTVD
ncbi:MAG: hypothetical protein KDA33_15785 [Phycisphaerales bacterium]|nr:hypothetical protein [Phycisphaerales bacterium]